MNRTRFSLPSRAPRNFLEWLGLPLLIVLIFGFAWRPLTGGDDFWAHAAIGRWILEHRAIPRHTLFLWSDSINWIAHAWGTGVWFSLLMRWGGPQNGPILTQIFNALMSMAPFVLLWRYWRQNAPFSSLMAPVFVLAIWISNPRFHPRPELFSALFLTLLMIFLSNWPHQKSLPKLQIAGILAMFALWPNFHGVVALGLVFLYVAAIAELWQARGDNRLLLLALVCTLLVFVCNPRGFSYYRVLLPIGSPMFKRIDEWKPFWAAPRLPVELWAGELILWAFSLLVWLKNPAKRLMQLGWLLLMLAAFLSARRQLWLLALASLLVIVSNFNYSSDDLFRGWRKLSKGDATQTLPAPLRLIARGGVLLILICAIAMAFPKTLLSVPPSNPSWPLHATSPNLPVKMAAFLRDHAPPGRIFNDYEFSAYLEWALHGKRTLYIDLNNAYHDSLMEEYFAVQASDKDAKKMAKDEDRRVAFLNHKRIKVVALRPYTDKEMLSTMAATLNKSPHWKRIYLGGDGTIWARK